MILLSAMAIGRSFGSYTVVAVVLYSLLILTSLLFLKIKAYQHLKWITYEKWILAAYFLFFVQLNTFFFRNHLRSPDWEHWLPYFKIIQWIALVPAMALFPKISYRLSNRTCFLLGLLIALLASALLICIPWISPNPKIDVLSFHDEAARALLAGNNPYTMEFSNPYGTQTPWYPMGSSVFFPYPPLSLLFAMLGLVLGDPRRVYLLCHIFSALVLYLLGRRLKIGVHESVLLSLLFLTIPGTPFLIEQGWTEPSIVLMLCLSSYFIASKLTPNLSSLFLGAALALKQTLIFFVPFLALARSLFWKNRSQTLSLLSLPLLSYGIFLIWNPYALWEDLVWFHLSTPFRPDGLTLSSLLFHRMKTGPLPGILSFVAALAGVILWSRAWFQEKRLFILWLAFGSTFLWVLFLSKHAFYNYYYLVHASLILGLVWARSDEIQRDTK